MKFTHLHVHSDASLKDGLGPVGNLVRAAKDKGFQALALTDHGTLANAVAFTVECLREGIKPILGVEGYISVEGEIGHITLLADGNLGWSNLVKLNNLGHASKNREPAFTLEQLIEHSEGLICLSGCVASPLNSLDLPTALQVGIQLKRAFGSRFIMEVMFIGDMPTWERPLTIARELNIPVVVTNDVHFADQNDADVHTVLTKIKAGFSYASSRLYLRDYTEIMHQAKRLMGSEYNPEEFMKWVKNAANIAAKIRPVTLKGEPHLPEIDDANLRLRTIIGGLTSGSELFSTPEYVERLEHELGIITKMGYASYFLILHDVISYAKANGVRVGAGRGSGAGSLALFAMGITEVDPIKYDLSFERFLNLERKSMPDVDVDFDSENRQIVLDYAKEKYEAIPIATYSKYMHKSLVHELGKFYRINKDLESAAAEFGAGSKQFRTICETRPEFERAYNAIIGQIRHKGKHAGGVIITETDVPIERTGGTLSAAWTEGSNNELSYAGVVKFDFLGLSALAILNRLESKRPFTYDIESQPNVFEVFKSGRLAGIFQFSGSPGIHDLTVKLQPNSIEDLTAINALYRPGALDAGTCQKYPDFKKSPRAVPPLFSDILEETYGVVVYQEQLMRIVQRALRGTFTEADLARSTITKGGKKASDPVIAAKIEDLKKRVIDGFVGQGLPLSEAKKWWSELETHGRYSFNKSHSTSYAIIAWQMAWWKTNYPALFYAECLNVDKDHSQDYIMAAIGDGIPIIRPDINLATKEWTADKGSIILPLSALKYLTVDTAELIVANRPPEGYSSIKEFMALNPKSKVRAQAREALYYMGSFSKISGEYADLGIKGPEKIKSATDAMLDYLGFVIPTRTQWTMMRDLTEKGYICGIIASRKAKKSAYGAYTVYYMSPSGIFWSRESVLEIGTIVGVKTTGKGRAKEVIRI